MNRDRGVLSTLRVAALLLATWLTFFGLEAAMSLAISPHSTSERATLIEIDVVIAVLWAGLSAIIAWWHRRARTIAPSVVALIASHVPLLMAATVIDTIVTRTFIAAITGTPSAVPFWGTLVYYADFDIVSYLAVVAVAEVLLVRRAALHRQQLAQRLEASLGRARLDYLEAQLQPHFLFNSLGAVSELAYDAPATANRVLQQLVAIFRTALATKSDEITLGEEIIGIEPYLDIQRIRFADWLTIEYRIDDNAVDCVLPRFVLQPLVENAIRHGLSGRSAAGTIEISAAVTDGSLIVRVTDNGVGLDAAAPSTGRGIGLANVRDRLAILYGDDNRLRLIDNASGGAIAELTIPARHRPSATVAPQPDRPDSIAVAPESDVPVLRVPALLRRRPVTIGIVWLLVGLLWAQQSMVYDMIRHRSDSGSNSWFTVDMTSAFIWALFTPMVLAAAKRFQIQRRHGVWIALGYLIVGALTTVAHAAILQQLTVRDIPLWSQPWQMTIVVGFVIFGILAAIGHRDTLLEWLRSREAAAATLSVELAEAQRRAVALQAIPAVLLHALDGIAVTVRRDPGLTERQLTRLADYLRLALESTDARGITPDRQRGLDAALTSLRDIGAYLETPSHTLTRSA